jgi:hypothetical protein
MVAGSRGLARLPTDSDMGDYSDGENALFGQVPEFRDGHSVDGRTQDYRFDDVFVQRPIRHVEQSPVE